MSTDQKTDQGVVLIVEDDPNDVLLTKRAFRKAGLTNPVHFVSDGEAAIDYLGGMHPYEDRQAFPLPRLILLDLKLPRKSGFDLLRWLRGQETIDAIAVVVLTSSAREADIDLAYQYGTNSYLVKPVEINALVEMVKLVVPYWSNLNVFPLHPCTENRFHICDKKQHSDF